MSETSINAYRAELEVAEKELDRAKSRVEELKAYIKDNEPEEETPVEESEGKNVEVEPFEPEEDKGEKIEIKTSKKGKK